MVFPSDTIRVIHGNNVVLNVERLIPVQSFHTALCFHLQLDIVFVVTEVEMHSENEMFRFVLL